VRISLHWLGRRQTHPRPQAPRTVSSQSNAHAVRGSELSQEEMIVGYPSPGRERTVRVELPGRAWSPEESPLKSSRNSRPTSSGSLGEPVTRAVYTVPATLTDAQRKRHQGRPDRLAGFEVERIVNEPTAAASAMASTALTKIENRRLRSRWRHLRHLHS